MASTGTRRATVILRTVSLAVAILVASATPAAAGAREQAKRIHDRLVGVPPLPDAHDSMEAQILAGDAIGAAYYAMDHPLFYSSALKNFATPWTNVERTVFADLNDYTATVIGMIRDDVAFDQVLSADLVYVGAPGFASTGYSQADNEHYRELEALGVDLGDPSQLVAQSQSGQAGSPLGPGDAAGVMTTRAAGEAFFSAGTNRRMWRFTSLNFLCRDLEDMQDITRPVDRIRQDVSRSPGGDSSVFHNTCTGCHSGMDPMAGAFAYYEWDMEAERLLYTPGQVQPKHLINAETFPYGYVTADDRWDNHWRAGINAALGWADGPGGGFGAKSLGEEITGSRAFSVCQVEKVFAQVCFRPVSSPADRAAVDQIADVFEGQNYSLKRVFAETAVYCMGD